MPRCLLLTLSGHLVCLIQIKLALDRGPLNFKVEVRRGWRKRGYLEVIMRANPLINSTSLVTLTALLPTLTMPPLAVAQTAFGTDQNVLCVINNIFVYLRTRADEAIGPVGPTQSTSQSPHWPRCADQY